MECPTELNTILYDYECYYHDCLEKFQDVLDAANHLKSSHDQRDGDLLQCMRLQRRALVCNTKFKSFKAMRKHSREKKCKLFSIDIKEDETQNENQNEIQNAQREGWDILIDDFGDLIIEKNATSEDENPNNSLAEYIQSFVNKLIISELPHDIVDTILKHSKDLVCMTTAMIKESMKNIESKIDAESILDSTENIVISHLDKFDTRYRRNKHYKNTPYYVAPQTCCVDGEETFQYVSILDTLKKLFAIKTFRDEYFAYNNNHQCRDGVYERYCCGKNYRESALFQSNKNSIQIQIFYDDVQLTSPLKTKPYKVCAIYFIVRNLPPNYVSKLDNMYLVSLCDSKIVDKYGYNTILERFVHDIQILETVGIPIDDEEDKEEIENIRSNDNIFFLKGTLVQVSFDNLGGNTIFGLTKCFNSMYYCRICICTKKVCKVKTIEVANKIRTKQEYYDQIIKIAQLHDKGVKVIQPKHALGIVNYSMLNDLKYFHTIDNRSQDVMHDIYEGAMPFILRQFFAHLINLEILGEKVIEEKIGSFDYGVLSRKNIPSKFCFKKKNLNQNASQMHCLMKHIPFIFVDLLQDQSDQSKKIAVHKVWPVIEYMQKIDQIISSTHIKEKDLINLEKFTDEFLKNVKNLFKVHFIPKLHHMTHYASTIRVMGPITSLQMMRGDAKHQPFTQYAKRCRNYINISKTLAEKHQQVLAAKMSKNTYCDNIETSKKIFSIVRKKGDLINDIRDHSKLIHDYFEQDLNQVMLINFVIINTISFRKGLFIIYSDEMHQIDAVLKCNGSFVFLCTKFSTVKFFKFANCFEIEKSEAKLLIGFDMLVCKRSYEAKFLNNETQIIADNLDMIPIYEKYIV